MNFDLPYRRYNFLTSGKVLVSRQGNLASEAAASRLSGLKEVHYCHA